MSESPDLAVRYVGQGVPVLFIHGWTMAGFVEAHDFEPIFSKRPGYRRIYIDLPGMGESPIGGVKDLDSMLEAVFRFVEENILPQRFLLSGSSCGAYLARALAYRYASVIDGLLLRVPVVEPDSSRRDVDSFTPVIADQALLASFPEADISELGDIPVHTREYMGTLRRRVNAIELPAVAASDSAALDAIRNDPDRYRLMATVHSPEEPFSGPTLIVTGRQDTDVGYRDAWSLVACYPRATFVALDRASHGLPVDENDVFAALVENWLWRVEELRRTGVSRLDHVR